MFLESQIDSVIQKGSIEVICGSMFSGKTEELLRRLKRAELAKLEIAVFKPKIDIRYNNEQIVSHDSNKIKSTSINSPSEIFQLSLNAKVIGIDEAQFFDPKLLDIALELAKKGKRVIIAGLDMDFLGNPFGVMPQLLSVADHVTKVHAICDECSDIANNSYRITNKEDLVEIGEKDKYLPLCRRCFSKKMQ